MFSRRLACQRAQVVAAAHRRLGAHRPSVLRVHVHAKPEYVLCRGKVRVVVPRARRQVRQSQPGPTAAGRGDHKPGGGAGRGSKCRGRSPPPPRDVPPRFLWIAVRRTFDRQRPGSVANPTQAAPGRRVPADRPVRLSDRHVAVYPLRDDVVRHLLPSVP